MGTRCSGLGPNDDVLATTWGNETPTETEGNAEGCATFALTGICTLDAPPEATAANTSPLVIRPSLPVPVTDVLSIWLSASSLAADGMANPALALPVTVLDEETAATGATAAAARALLALPCVSMRAMSCSAETVLPSPITTSASTPAPGAGTSSTTLSVSTSINISSAATTSPTFFFQFKRVASATDSDNCGTFTSRMAISNLYSSMLK